MKFSTKNIIYLDNNATTKIDKEVFIEMKKYSLEYYANPSSIHSFANYVNDKIYETRVKIAKFINANFKEIFFVPSASWGNNLVFDIVTSMQKKQKTILISSIEHPSVRETAKKYQALGFNVIELKVTQDGYINLDEADRIIKQNDILLASVMLVNNETGIVLNIFEFKKLLENKDIFFHVDAVQALGKIDKIDVKNLNVDFMTFSAHKIHGPKGIGILYVNEKIKLKPIIFGGKQEQGIIAGTENVAGILGFSKVIDILKENGQKYIDYQRKLRDYFELELKNKIDNIIIVGENSKRIPNTSYVIFKEIPNDFLIFHLDKKNIFVSHTSACKSGAFEPSYVIRNMGFSYEEARSGIRFSLSKYTTLKQIKQTIKVLNNLIKDYSNKKIT